MRLFKRKWKKDSEGFYLTGISAETLRPNQITSLTIYDTDIILTIVDANVISFSASCPHAAADLNTGHLYRGKITCPDHDWKFDIRTGRTLWPPDEFCRLRLFPTKIVAGCVAIQIEIQAPTPVSD